MVPVVTATVMEEGIDPQKPQTLKQENRPFSTKFWSQEDRFFSRCSFPLSVLLSLGLAGTGGAWQSKVNQAPASWS